jgi:chloramphenicol 3-O-phosphotransferase
MPQALREPPLSIRLSTTERAVLTRRAGTLGLSTYIKTVLFTQAAMRGRQSRKSADRVLLAQLLGQLGASGLAQRMKSLADAADSGSLHLDDLTISVLHDACDDLRGMHLLLLQALGKKVPSDAVRPKRLSVLFVRAAADTEAPL